MALFTVMAATAVLAIICAVSFNVAKTDIRIAQNHLAHTRAFANADGGVSYGKAMIEAAVAAGVFPYITNNSSVAVNYPAPGAFTFDAITNVSRTAGGGFCFTVVGRDGGARASITTVWSRSRLMRYGVFGKDLADLKANGFTYSYDSTLLPPGVNPATSDSTRDADVASDGTIITHNGTFVDGDLVLGASSTGVDADWSGRGGGATVTGESGVNVGYIDPDPLGVDGGELSVVFAAVAAVNDNALAVPPIVGNSVSMGNGQTLTLRSGNYYLTSFRMGNGSILNINPSNGPVNVYLAGDAVLVNSSAINGGGRASDFSLFSNSSATITVGNSADFKGLIYAPLAKIDMKNSGDVYGVIWGNDVHIFNSANMFVDTGILDRHRGKKLTLVSWKENRGG